MYNHRKNEYFRSTHRKWSERVACMVKNISKKGVLKLIRATVNSKLCYALYLFGLKIDKVNLLCGNSGKLWQQSARVIPSFIAITHYPVSHRSFQLISTADSNGQQELKTLS